MRIKKQFATLGIGMAALSCYGDPSAADAGAQPENVGKVTQAIGASDVVYHSFNSAAIGPGLPPVVASLKLPAGQYKVEFHASASLNAGQVGGYPPQVSCQAYVPFHGHTATAMGTFFHTINSPGYNQYVDSYPAGQQLSLSIAGIVAGGFDPVSLYCQSSSGVTLWDGTLIATPLPNLVSQ